MTIQACRRKDAVSNPKRDIQRSVCKRTRILPSDISGVNELPINVDNCT